MNFLKKNPRSHSLVIFILALALIFALPGCSGLAGLVSASPIPSLAGIGGLKYQFSPPVKNLQVDVQIRFQPNDPESVVKAIPVR